MSRTPDESNMELTEHYLRKAKILWVQLTDVESLREKDCLFEILLASVTSCLGIATSAWFTLYAIAERPALPLQVIAWTASVVAAILAIASIQAFRWASTARKTLRRREDYMRIPPSFSSPEKGPIPASKDSSTTEDIFPGETR